LARGATDADGVGVVDVPKLGVPDGVTGGVREDECDGSGVGSALPLLLGVLAGDTSTRYVPAGVPVTDAVLPSGGSENVGGGDVGGGGNEGGGDVGATDDRLFVGAGDCGALLGDRDDAALALRDGDLGDPLLGVALDEGDFASVREGDADVPSDGVVDADTTVSEADAVVDAVAEADADHHSGGSWLDDCDGDRDGDGDGDGDRECEDDTHRFVPDGDGDGDGDGDLSSRSLSHRRTPAYRAVKLRLPCRRVIASVCPACCTALLPPPAPLVLLWMLLLLLALSRGAVALDGGANTALRHSTWLLLL